MLGVIFVPYVFKNKGYACASFQKFWKKNWKPKTNVPF
jgi:hypothetical protein